MRALIRSAVAILFLLSAEAVRAQVCTGNAPFSSGNMRIGGLASFSDGVQAFGGGFTVGSPGVFGGITLGSASYDDFDGSSFLLGGSAGYQMTLGSTSAVQLCPIASADFAFGPNDIEGTGVDASARAFSFGAAVGGVLSSSPQLQVIPAGILAFVSSRFELDDGVDSFSDSETYGLASLGIGFVLNNAFTFQPNISIPFGLDESDPTYGFSVALNFGQRR